MLKLKVFTFILLAALVDCLPARAQTAKTIVVIGSSTAFGTGAKPIDSSWVNRLRNNFQNYNSKNRIVNLAVGGYTTFKLIPSNQSFQGRPLPDTLKNCSTAIQLKPDLILINLPTNDIAADYTDEEIMRNYGLITEQIRQKHIPFFITSTQPRNFKDKKQLNRIKTLTDLLLKAYPDQIVNYLEKLSLPNHEIKPEVAAGDGVHLNNNGHEIIYDAMFKLPFYQKLAASSSRR